jgi:hypothetical protein
MRVSVDPRRVCLTSPVPPDGQARTVAPIGFVVSVTSLGVVAEACAAASPDPARRTAAALENFREILPRVDGVTGFR